MKVFFDNCTSPVLAAILDAWLQTQGGAAYHIRFMADLGMDARTSDTDWMSRLASDWIVVTADDHIRRNKAERLAWKQARLKGFVFARGFQKMAVHQRASTLLWRWPDMERFISSAAQGSLFELPVSRSGGFLPLTV